MRRHRGRVRRQLRRHVGAPARREGRGEHPAPGGRALLPHHREDPRGSPAAARCSRIPASYGYFREEVGGLMVGLFEPVCAPWKVGGRAGGLLVRRDHPRLGPHGPVRRDGDDARAGRRSRPASRSSSAARRASRRTCSRSSARRRSCRNYFVAAGLNSIGILTGGGLGRVLAHWIINGAPDVDVTGFNIDRLHTLPGEPGVPAHAHGRVARHGLPVPLPDALDADRARREACRRSTTGSRRAARTSAT